MVSNISAYDTIFLVSHLFPLNGMYSMNLTLTGLSFANFTKSNNSSSFCPRTTTTFTFTVSIPIRTASSIEFNTFSNPSLLVINSNFAFTNESKLTLMDFSPLRFNASSLLFNAIPFVVIATCSIPSIFVIRSTMSTKSFLTVGSPPVRRTFRTPPSRANSFTNRSISSVVNKSSFGAKSMPSSGMQYRHRRLHLSVNETRK
mmetsp:Transcript_947/g.2759  ORF Transcript_947/g.2759 Transcript_947/m.2759 type:complete len:202 (+) Transcript_947:2930-3535(+)